MEPLSLNVLREKYLSFFESKGHLRLESFPLVPQNDNSLLLINAGMAPLKPYFKGERVPPRKRVTTCQKCVRTLDIDNVGKTSRHGTFFEMLGNFSFGDYFKEEAIPWAWEFLTKVLEIPESRLYPSVYVEDDEALEIWVKTGVPRERITKLGKDDNFWEIGAGPCGPCSEIYFDRGPEFGCGKPDCGPGCDCDRFIEIWNIVFTQFDGDGNGNYTRLAHPNIDTGMGLERLATVMQGVGNLFEVDTIRNIMRKVCEIAGVEYGGSSAPSDVSLRVITDHIRTAVFLISDGVIPSNEGRGYILRRVLRRAARHGRLLGIRGCFLDTLCDTVVQENRGAYPALAERLEYIRKTIRTEEERFGQTIDAGLGILEKMLEHVSGGTLDGASIFRLYDTFGFPPDLTKEITAEHGINIDEDEFKRLMQQQKERARAARAGLGDVGWTDASGDLIDKTVKTVFTGYDELSCGCEIRTILADDESVSVLAGGRAVLVLDRTPFYAEGGGQVGDSGEIITDTGVFRVEDTKKTPEGQYLHIGFVASGSVALGAARAEVNAPRRRAIMRNHSSVHLLQAALRRVLGTHVEQSGSYVDENRARFDFTHTAALTPDELQQVELLVNEQILAGSAVTATEMPIDEAKKLGAMALFGEKYGDVVRVVRMGDFSVELCGGTHIDDTAKIGMFKILGESSVASGVRRIEAVTGLNTLGLLHAQENNLLAMRAVLKANSVDELVNKAEALQNEFKFIKKALEKANITATFTQIAAELEKAETVGGLRLVTSRFADIPVDALREASDRLRAKNDDVVCVFASVSDGKITFAAGCGKAALEAGANAGALLKALSPIVGGGGGGRPDSATSGGRDVSRLDEALGAAAGLLAAQLGA